jgi:hypothetical protein
VGDLDCDLHKCEKKLGKTGLCEKNEDARWEEYVLHNPVEEGGTLNSASI